MAPRTSARLLTSASSTPGPAPSRPLQTVAHQASTSSPQLLELRRQWKWAALSQFFFTFAPLIALEDVTLVDVETDLVESTMIVLPRLMQRLLITLSNDRKITVDNWQSALRRQYLRRDPAANPIGNEIAVPKQSRATTVTSDVDDRVLSPELANREEVVENKTSKDDEETMDGQGHEETDGGLREGSIPRVRDVSMKAGTKATEEDLDETGVEQESKDWSDLPMLDKLDSLHKLTEWHFQNPLRLRQIMRSDDENASWRIEPIGFDAKRNSYWFIGPDRLWIQRELPRPPTKSSKRKAKQVPSHRKAKIPRLSKPTPIKSITEANSSNRSTPSRSNGRSKKAKSSKFAWDSLPSEAVDDTPSTPGSSRRGRAAKTQANAKLDLQAKQLAAAKAEFDSLNRRSKGSSSRPLGTRVSRRLRGADDDDDGDWQQIPPEWLEENSEPISSPTKRSKRISTRTSARISFKDEPRKLINFVHEKSEELEMDDTTGLDGDDVSDLTELSDSETSIRKAETSKANERSELPASDDVNQNGDPENVEPWPPVDFIEWETICVTLFEWENIAARFEKATSHLEKYLFKRLSQEIVPYVTENLKEAERQRQKEEALMNRKRSSRLAIRESEKEAARQAAVKQAEEEEKLARMRRSEGRARREEDERVKREEERDRRRREREERELARSRRVEMLARGETEQIQEEKEETPNSVKEEEVKSKAEDKGKTRGRTKDMGTSSRNSTVKSANGRDNQASKASRRQSKKRKVSGEDWELDCELCGVKGRNRDGDVPLMSCGRCGKWQHISCHDAVDDRARRPRRNWDVVDFFCLRCRGIEQSAPNQNGMQMQYEQAYPRLHPSSMASSYLSSSGLVPITSNGIIQTAEPRLAVNGQKTPMNYMAYTHRGPAPDIQFRNGETALVAGQSVPSIRPHNPVTFAHYQPLQRGFAPHPTAQQPQDSSQSYGQSHTSYPIQSSIRDQKDNRVPSGTVPLYHPPANGQALPQYPAHSLLQQASSSLGHSPQTVVLQPISPHYKPAAPSNTQPYYTS